jgi:hypothetical protein
MRVVRTVLSVILVSSRASAQTVDPEVLMRGGVEARHERRDDAALQLFTQAYDITHSARALAQVGLAEQALGRWAQAENHLRQAIAQTTDPWIERNAGALGAALGVIARHLGSLRIDGDVVGAEVLADGQLVGTLPMSAAIRVVAGPVAVEVRAPGRVTVRREVTIAVGGEAREVVRLRLSPAAVPDAPPPAPEVSPGVPETSEREQQPRLGRVRLALAWSSLAGAAVGAGIATGAVVVREGQVADYNADVACPGIRSGSQPARCATLVDRTGSMETIATAAFVGAGILAAATTVLFLTGSGRSSARAQLPWFACGVGPGMNSIQCAGRF